MKKTPHQKFEEYWLKQSWDGYNPPDGHIRHVAYMAYMAGYTDMANGIAQKLLGGEDSSEDKV